MQESNAFIAPICSCSYQLPKLQKYKTMTDERDEEGNLLPDEKRLTKVSKHVIRPSISG